MTMTSQIIRHKFAGGWATDFGAFADISPDQSGSVEIPFLTEAQDCIFELDGGPHEIGGSTALNGTAVASGAAVMGLYDYWRWGTSGTATRRRILHAGTVCMHDANDATFVNLFTGLTSGAVPSYSTFDDLLIISSDSGTDVPKSWDQTTAQSLAGTPPTFAFSCPHKNRLWAAGAIANPSRLYYSENLDPENWATSGAGSIDIDPSDGDQITGLVSHKNDLWVFKGPNKGSIHRITGSSPTGSDGFSRVPYSHGIGAAWHNAIFHFGSDIGFVSQFGSVHSLKASQDYGDFEEAALSRPINRWIRQHLNYAKLRNIWAKSDPLLGLVYITMAVDSATNNNVCLVMDYRGYPNIIRWSRIPAYAYASLGLFVDTSSLKQMLAGGYDGVIYRINVTDRSINAATALNYYWRTPSINYGNPMVMKSIEAASVGFTVKGNFASTFAWQADQSTEQVTTINQGGSDVLGTATTHQFTLDTSVLGGATYAEVYTPLNETGGEFRSIQYSMRQSAANQDIEIHSFSVLLTESGINLENT